VKAKEKKSAAELVDIIMREMRQHPEWSILNTLISQPKAGPHRPNWEASFLMKGPRIAPEAAWSFVGELRSQFDLLTCKSSPLRERANSPARPALSQDVSPMA
jgi:hypothetical protein